MATLAASALTAWITEDDVPPAAPQAARVPTARVTAAVAAAPGPVVLPEAALPPRTAWAPATPAALRAWGEPAPVAPPPKLAAAPAPAAAPPPAPETPTAPPLTYRFIGRIVQEGRQHAMLLSPQGDLKVVVENELVDGQWRIEHIAERAVDLVWTPGAEKRRLVIATT